MNETLRVRRSTGLTVTLAVLYGWLGLAAHGVDRALGLSGALLVLAVVSLARRTCGLKLMFIVDTWVSDHYGDPHAEAHPHHPAARP